MTERRRDFWRTLGVFALITVSLGIVGRMEHDYYKDSGGAGSHPFAAPRIGPTALDGSASATPEVPDTAEGPSAPLRYRRITFSVYAVRYDGRRTSSGERYDHALTTEPFGCASNEHPLGTWLSCRVPLLEIDVDGEPDFKGEVLTVWHDVVARVNDRMDGTLSRTRIDLSGGAYWTLDLSGRYDFTDSTAGLLKGEYAVLTEEQAQEIIAAHKNRD